jgi:hypothetical protein
MQTFIKWIVAIVGSIFILAVSLIPESVMYFVWGLVNPASEVGKIALAIGFWIGGGGLCFLFGFLGLSLWVAFIGFMLDL